MSEPEKPVDRTLRGLQQAVDYAKGSPGESTRRSFYDPQHDEWKYETFRDGKWIKD